MEAVTLSLRSLWLGLWGQEQGKPFRVLLFSAASHMGPRDLSQELRRVVMPLTSNKKSLFPVQMAVPRSGLQGSLQKACGMGQEQDLTPKYGPSLGSHLVSHW